VVITALWLRHEEDKKTFSDGKFESQLFFFFLNVPASKFSVCSVCSISWRVSLRLLQVGILSNRSF
jgi:hypothetical protein